VKLTAAWIFSLCVLLLLPSCNIYSLVSKASSDQDRVEEGQKCLHKNDYPCAIENYQAISDPNLKYQKLCLVYLLKVGVTLNTLLSVVTQANSSMLGNLSQKMLPWNDTKGTDAATGKDYCLSLSQLPDSGATGVLLKTLGMMVDCAVRMAKTDQFVGADALDTVCTTPGDRNGRISVSDIESAGGQVMCSSDVTLCQSDLSQISGSSLSQNGLNDIKGGVDSIPAALTDNTAALAAVRAAIQSTVPADSL
jgi:hypothetical protein